MHIRLSQIRFKQQHNTARGVKATDSQKDKKVAFGFKGRDEVFNI